MLSALLEQHGAWALSALSLWMMIELGMGLRRGWKIGLYSQALWLAWIIATANWGFLPLTIALICVYALNWTRWKEKELPEQSDQLGWVVANGQGDHYRCWEDGPAWTNTVSEALIFARRKDAEEFSADDEDAWLILRVRFPLTMAEIEFRRISRLHN